MHSDNFLKNTLFYSLIFLPILLVTGPFLSDLCISISGIIFIYLSVKEKLFKFYSTFFFKFFSIFFLYICFLFFLYEEKDIYHLLKPITMLRFLVFSGAVYYINNVNKNFKKYLFYSLIITFSALLIDGIIQFSFGKNIFFIPISSTGRVSSFFGDELILGSYISRFLPLLLSLYFLNFKFENSILVLIILFLSFILVIISGERTALFIITTFTLLFIFFIDEFRKIRFVIFPLIFFIFSLLIFLNTDLKKRYIDDTIFFLLGKNSDQSIKFINDEYHHIYKSSLIIFKENKFIGTSINSFRQECKDVEFKNKTKERFKCSSHQHNIYLQLLSDVGIFPFLAIFALFCYLVYELLTNKQKSNFKKCLLIYFIITLLPFIPSGNAFNNWLNILYFFPVGFYLSSKY